MSIQRLMVVVLLGCGLVASAATAWAAESACVKCHTSDATLKTLFTPPAQVEGEGEG